MSDQVITVSPRLGLRELALLFESRRISGAPVVDDDGSILGVVTQSDLSRVRAHPPLLETDESFYRCPTGVDIDPTLMRTDGGGLCREHGPCPADVSPQELAVEDVMSPTVYSIEVDLPLPEVARTMLKHQVHRLLVTRKGRIVGIVTGTDLLRAVAEGAARP